MLLLLLLQVYENLQEDGVLPDDKLYCHLITAAGRAGDLALALNIYRQKLASCSVPSKAQRRKAAAPATTSRSSSGSRGAKDAGSSGSNSSRAQDAGSSSGSSSRAKDAGSRSGANGSSGSSSRGEDASSKNVAKDSSSSSTSSIWREQMPIEISNAVLSAYAHVGDGRGAMKFFQQQVLAKGLAPDSYSFSALLTAVARNNGTPLSVVEQLRMWMEEWEVPVGVVIGTALINAYRRVRTWGGTTGGWEMTKGGKRAAGAVPGGGVRGLEGSAGLSGGAGEGGSSCEDVRHGEEEQRQQQGGTGGADLQSWVVKYVEEGLPEGEALGRAVAVLRELQGAGVAKVLSYTVLMAFCLELGEGEGYKEVREEAEAAGVVLGEEAYDVLVRAAEEGGLMAVAGELRGKWQEWKAREERLEQQMQQQGKGGVVRTNRNGAGSMGVRGMSSVAGGGGSEAGGGDSRQKEQSQEQLVQEAAANEGSTGGLLAAAAAAAQQQQVAVVEQGHVGVVQAGKEALLRRPAPPVLRAR